MIPASLFLDGPVDPVLCDCGEEIRQLYTLDHAVGGVFEYHVVGGALYAVATWTRAEVAVSEDSLSVRRHSQRLMPGQYLNPFRASVVCLNPECGSLSHFEFSLDENGIVCASRSLDPSE